MKDKAVIEEKANEAYSRECESSRFPGMTYEQGVAAALRWALDTSGREEDPLS